MEKQEMFEQLKKIICNYVEVNPDDIREDSRFVEDLNFNSYDFMCMVGEIEDSFEIEIEEQKASKILTIQDAIDYFASLQEE